MRGTGTNALRGGVVTGPQHAAPGQSFDSFADFFKDSAYGSFPQEHRTSALSGLTLMQIDMQPLDFVDAPVPEFLIQRTHDSVSEIVVDVGDGLKRHVRPVTSSVVISPPDTEVRYCVPEPSTWTMAALPAEAVLSTLDEANVRPAVLEQYFGRLVDNPRAVRVLDEMWRVGSSGLSSSALYLDGLALQLLALLCEANEISPSAAGSKDARIARAIEYIEAHYSESLNLAEIAEVVGLSVGHFTRSFKAASGESVWSYVQRRRSERAKELLLTTRLPIAQIAHDCGFANQSHLTTCFRCKFGVTPAAARRKAW